MRSTDLSSNRIPSATRWLVLLGVALLAACAVPERAPAPTQYDFGLPAVDAASPAAEPRPALALRVQASPALESPAMLYRLAYADAQQLRAYSRARWSMPPAELVQQRLREGLGRQYAMLRPGDVATRVLQLDVEEFSQVFEAADRSHGLLQLRVTAWQVTPSGERMLGQRTLQVRQPAATADAGGGVVALRGATDAALDELQRWLAQLR